MMSIAVELNVMRRQTKAYIEREPVKMILNREEATGDGQGGVIITSGPIPVQTFAFDAMSLPQQGQIRRTVDAQEVQPEYALMGEYNADVKRGDWFFLEGIKYEVVFVHPDRTYQVFAEVAYRG